MRFLIFISVTILAQDVFVEATHARESHKTSARHAHSSDIHCTQMRIIVRTAGGAHCEVLPSSNWTSHDLHVDIQKKHGIPVSQQRLLHGSETLDDFMAAAAVGTMGPLLQLSAGHEGILELLVYIRSTAVTQALDAVKQNGAALRHASQELKGDREVVLEAVKQNGAALRYASEELKRDREVVLEAVKLNGEALQHASQELKRDREVVLEAVKQNGEALRHASEELKRDREVVLEAVKQNSHALRHASHDLKGDRGVVMEAVKQDGNTLGHASEELKRDREVVLEAVKQNGSALRHASQELKRDRELVIYAGRKARRFSMLSRS